jgi:hypothetical protein
VLQAHRGIAGLAEWCARIPGNAFAQRRHRKRNQSLAAQSRMIFRVAGFHQLEASWKSLRRNPMSDDR